MPLPLATSGPEGNEQPLQSAPINTGFLASTRKRAIGNASFVIDATKICALYNLPGQAVSAIMVVEAAAGTADPSAPLIRIWMDGLWPSAQSGLPAYNGATLEIQGEDDLKNLRMSSVDGLNHTINIQYFSNL